MARVILEVPDDLVQAIKLPAEEIPMHGKFRLSRQLYERALREECIPGTLGHC